MVPVREALGLGSKHRISWIWWLRHAIHIITVLGGWRQEDHKFKVSLSYTVSSRPAKARSPVTETLP